MENDAEYIVIGLLVSKSDKFLQMMEETIHVSRKNFGVFMQNPLENGSDDAPEV